LDARYLARIENGVSSTVMRDKPVRALCQQPHEGDQPGQPYGLPGFAKRHANGRSIADYRRFCAAGGRGRVSGMVGWHQPVTEIASIDEAVMAYVEGKIVDRTDWLH
jgi:hypothetical protein